MSACGPCANIRNKYLRYKNYDHYQLVRDKNYGKVSYGLSEEEYQKLLVQSGGKCNVCKLPARLFIDHSHETNKIRGMLCINCNLSLGHAKDSIEILQSMINYLDNKELKSEYSPI